MLRIPKWLRTRASTAAGEGEGQVGVRGGGHTVTPQAPPLAQKGATSLPPPPHTQREGLDQVWAGPAREGMKAGERVHTKGQAGNQARPAQARGHKSPGTETSPAGSWPEDARMRKEGHNQEGRRARWRWQRQTTSPDSSPGSTSDGLNLFGNHCFLLWKQSSWCLPRGPPVGIQCFGAGTRPGIPFSLPTHCCHCPDCATLSTGGVGPPPRCQAQSRVQLWPSQRGVQRSAPRPNRSFLKAVCVLASSLPPAMRNDIPESCPFSLGSQNAKHILENIPAATFSCTPSAGGCKKVNKLETTPCWSSQKLGLWTLEISVNSILYPRNVSDLNSSKWELYHLWYGGI